MPDLSRIVAEQTLLYSKNGSSLLITFQMAGHCFNINKEIKNASAVIRTQLLETNQVQLNYAQQSNLYTT
ncbi:hypothetical protein JHK85_008879 [Glycine max]|uniref:Uncharacterized protein n=1 Tax=Glycine max TaxID=3847 RepID=A0A0R0K6Z6_SOYBN|nr:hypothetical protein JHK85_008879 [Glycine max]KAG5064909.1 hypothetical protein JHK86_008640 [Glycine max]KAH1109093.1 hypothetical protein GYH30_008473 [Glycine max]